MSGQNRLPKSSPNLVKQGPLKATIPISSVMKPSSNLMPGSSSTVTVSPTCYWKNKASLDQNSGQRSPGSVGYKGKSKSESEESGSSIRRTSSLDTIYLQGQWPTEGYYYGQMGTLQIDKAVQTDDLDMSDSRLVACTSETDDKPEQKRPKVWNTKDLGIAQVSPGENTINSSSQTLSTCILSPTFHPGNLNLKPLPKSSIRSSVEGLNQEIERLVLKTDGEAHNSRSYDSGRYSESIPEGHRAPIADIFKYASRSRSVDTQTPQKFGNSSNSSSDSQGSSPDQETSKLGSSPQINRFLAREPPDGCEKVQSKSLNDKKFYPVEHIPQMSTFKLKPSLGSAFQILQPTKSNNAEKDLPTVPSQESQSDE